MLDIDRTIALAKEKGWSNTFLAKKLGRTSASLFVDWRKGKSKPSEQDITALANLLDTSIEYLTGITDEKKRPAIISDDEPHSELEYKLLKKFRDAPPAIQKLVLEALRADD